MRVALIAFPQTQNNSYNKHKPITKTTIPNNNNFKICSHVYPLRLFRLKFIILKRYKKKLYNTTRRNGFEYK